MITRLHLENFKAWKHVDLEFGQLTGIFGKNSSGKSSLFQFLLMLKQTRNATDPQVPLNLGGPGQLVNLGLFEEILYGQDPDLSLSWQLEWTGTAVRQFRTRRRPGASQRVAPPRAPRLEIDSVVRLYGSRFETESLWYRSGGLVAGVTRRDDGDYELRDEKGPIRLSDGRGVRSFADQLIPSKGYVVPIPPFLRFGLPGRTGTDPARRRRWFELHRIAHEYEVMMDSIRYLGPLREPPRRIYRFGGSRPSDLGIRGEMTMDVLLAETKAGRTIADSQGREQTLQATIARWLHQMDLVEGFRLERIREYNLSRALVTTRSGGIETPLTDVGFGVSQILPVLVLLGHADEGSVVLLEQPEIHLHPSAQSALADVFLEVVKSRRLQIIVESHSEHLLRRIQRRRAEGASGADAIRLFFVSGERDGARLSDLELDRYGQIRNWPKDFFGDELGEVFAIQEAGLRRRMEEES